MLKSPKLGGSATSLICSLNKKKVPGGDSLDPGEITEILGLATNKRNIRTSRRVDLQMVKVERSARITVIGRI